MFHSNISMLVIRNVNYSARYLFFQQNNAYGEAGSTIVIEEKLEGSEISVSI